MDGKMEKLTKGGRLEETKFGRKTGVLLTAGISIVLLLLSLPFFDWVYLKNISALFGKMGISRETASTLYQSYSIFSLLGFVKNSGLGALGLYSMVLLLLLLGTWYLHIAYMWKALRNRFKDSDGKGMLRLYVTGKAAMLLTILLVAGSYGFVLYSNRFFGMRRPCWRWS